MDSSPPSRSDDVTSKTIATFLDGDHRGPVVSIAGIGSLDGATAEDLAFSVYDSKEAVIETDAGAVLCSPDIGTVDGQTQIVVSDPRLGFARASTEFFRPPVQDGPPHVHDTAHVHPDAELGEGTRIGPHVCVAAPVQIGERCTIRAGTSIGGAGFGFARDEHGIPHRLAHTGTVRIGSGVEIGPNCSIDRAVFDETLIEDDAKLSAHVHVAHNVTIGRATMVAFGAGFGGGASIGDRVTIHPAVAVGEGVTVGDAAEVGMNSTVLEDLDGGLTAVGSPARPVNGDERTEAARDST